MRGRSWTVEEEEKLIELWNNTPLSYKQIGSELNRSLNSVEGRIRKLRKAGLLDYRNPNKIKNKYEKDLSNVGTLAPSGVYFIISTLCDGMLEKGACTLYSEKGIALNFGILCVIY